jgi:hypothetical protein
MRENTKNLISDFKNLTFTRILFDSISLLILFYLLFPFTLRAETHVNSSDMRNGLSWNINGSPYILDENVYLSSENSLYIQEGVEIISGKDPDTEETFYLGGEGDMWIQGSEEKPVKITQLSSLDVTNGNLVIKNAIIDGTGIKLFNSTSTIESTVIKNTFEAIRSERSRIKIKDSILSDNSYGIFSSEYEPVFQVRNNIENNYGIGGEGDMSQAILDRDQNIISISNSSILNNSNFEIINQTTNPIDARNNWWGSSEGPNTSKISGLVSFDPWILSLQATTSACCSNVLFIPGIKASRLYKDGLIGENRLWEPNGDSDVEKLYMDEDGQSIDPNIYTRDVIDYGYIDIEKSRVYKNFINSMNSLVDEKKINAWVAYAYDWRKSPLDIIDEGLFQKSIDLASSSMTNKITIIAHSNGGLVAKALAKKLEDQGKDIVENIIFVATPELGTPSAIPALLHGYEQSLIGKGMPTENTARIFSKNLASAYGLLPGKQFFNNNPLTVITDQFFSSSTISSYEDMKNFLLNNSFSKDNSIDLNYPIKLNSKMLSLGESFHSFYDFWKPKDSIKSLSIVGSGVSTPYTLRYKPKDPCLPSILVCRPEFKVEKDFRGDGTVVVGAKTDNLKKTEYFDLLKLKDEKDVDISHANVMESSDLINKLKDIITGQTGAVRDYNKYFSSEEPKYNIPTLTVTVHSPLDMNVYDKKGRHTGPIPKTNPISRYFSYEQEIPNSDYDNLGGTKVIRLLYGEDYRFELTGTDSGVFYIDAEVDINNELIATTSFPVMPVSLYSNIELVVSTSTKNFASTTYMYMDVGGDGLIDYKIETEQTLGVNEKDPLSFIQGYLEVSKRVIETFNLRDDVERQWLSRIDSISKKLEKKYPEKIDKVINKLMKKSLISKKITEDQKKETLKFFDQILRYLETL